MGKPVEFTVVVESNHIEQAAFSALTGWIESSSSFKINSRFAWGELSPLLCRPAPQIYLW
jgi:hypothetical protein